MYPTHASRVPIRGTALVGALVAAQLLSNPPPARLVIQVRNSAARRILLLTPDAQQACVCPEVVWQELLPILHALVRGPGVSRARLPHTALLVVPDAPDMALSEVDIAQAWMIGAGTEAAGAAAWASHIPAAAMGDPDDLEEWDDPDDPSDEPAGVPLVAHDSLQMVAIETRFDPALLYARRRVPPGVRVVGLRFTAQHVLLVLDGPEAPGAPIPAADVQPLAAQLVSRALQAHPGAGGVVIEVATRQVYAVSPATLLSVVAHQQLPRPEQLSPLGWMVAFVPGIVREMVDVGARHAHSPSGLVRAVAALTCPLFLVLAALAYWLLKATSVDPIYSFIATTPGLTPFIQPPYVLSVAGLSISIAAAFAWLPTIMEHLGLAFATSPSWRRWFWVFVGIDIFCTSIHWITTFLPAGFAPLFAHYPFAIALAAAAGWVLAGLIAGAGFALFWEVIGMSSVVLFLALSPAVGTLVMGLIQGVGIVAIRTYYALQRLGNAWGEEVAEQRASLGVRQVVVDTHTGRILTPGPVGLTMIGLVTLLLLAGAVALVLRAIRDGGL